jgi:hypothetical protein
MSKQTAVDGKDKKILKDKKKKDEEEVESETNSKEQASKDEGNDDRAEASEAKTLSKISVKSKPKTKSGKPAASPPPKFDRSVKVDTNSGRMGEIHSKTLKVGEEILEPKKGLDNEPESDVDIKIRNDSLLSGVISGKNSSLNKSVTSNDLSWSMSHFLSTKSDTIGRLYGFDLILSPDKTYVYKREKDIYNGKSFPSKTVQWAARLDLACDVFLDQVRLRMNMAQEQLTFQNDDYIQIVDQYRPKTQQELLDLFHGTVDYSRTMIGNIQQYTSADRITVNASIDFRGAKLRTRMATCYWNQGLHLPRPTQYLLDSLDSIFTIYYELAEFNIASNRYQLRMNTHSITNVSHVAMRHVVNGLDVSPLLTLISTRLPNFRYYMYNRIKALINEIIVLKAGNSVENTALIANTMNITLTSVSTVNAMPGEIFSTEVSTVFLALTAGSCMPGMYRFGLNFNFQGALDIKNVTNIMSYLMYVPATMLDARSVASMKDYLWRKLLGSFVWSRNATCVIFNSQNPGLTAGGVSMRRIGANAIAGPLNAEFNSWELYVTALAGAPGVSPIEQFFSFPFTPRDARNGRNILFLGPTRYRRYELCLNFISAVTSFSVQNGLITTGQKNQMVGLGNTILNQFIGYGEYTRYMTATVDYVMSLGLSSFGAHGGIHDLELSPTSFFAMTVKMNAFQADFSSAFYKSIAWSKAVKAEIGIVLNVFEYFFNTANYWASFYRERRSTLVDFVKPFINKFKIYATTDIAKWVWENYLEVMYTLDVRNADVVLFDLLDFGAGFNDILVRIEARELACGYRESIAINLPAANVTGPGLAYGIHVSNTDPAPFTYTRRELSNSITNAVRPSVVNSRTMVNNTQEHWRSFRIIPTELTSDTQIDQTSIKHALETSSALVEIPYYYRWAFNANIFADSITTKHPMYMPYGNVTNFFGRILVVDLGAEANTHRVQYFKNEPEDILYQGSNNMDTFFEMVQLDI